MVAASGCKCSSSRLDVSPSAEVAPPDIVYKRPNYDLGLTLNDATSETLWAGWPIVLRLQGAWFTREAGSVTFSADTLELEVRAVDGSLVVLPWRIRQPPPAVSTLSLATPNLELLWTLDAVSATALAPGEYNVSAKWGEFRTQRLNFKVAPAPNPLTADDRLARARLDADIATFRGESAQAAIASGLAENPADPMLLTQRALELEDAGDLKGAMRAINQAYELLSADAGEDPFGLIVPSRIRNRLERKALAIIRDGGHL